MKPVQTIVRLSSLVMAILFSAHFACAQEKQITAKDVPAAVLTAFKTAYPQATIRGYAREKENGKVYYEIESREGKMTRDVLYNADGTVAEIEESIDADDLPADAQQAIQQKYPKAIITKVEKTTAGEKVSYEVSAKQGRKRISMEFDSSGKVLSRTKSGIR